MSLAQSLVASLTMFFTITKNTVIIALGAALSITTAVLLGIILQMTMRWLDQRFDEKSDEKQKAKRMNTDQDGSAAVVLSALFSASGYGICLIINAEHHAVVWMVVNSYVMTTGITLGLTVAALTVVGCVIGAAELATKLGKA